MWYFIDKIKRFLKIKRGRSYEKIYRSFKSNFLNDPKEEPKWTRVFEMLVKEVENLEIKDVFVDVGRKRGVIDMSLCLPSGIGVSLSKELGDHSDSFMYAFSKDHHVLSIGATWRLDLRRRLKKFLGDEWVKEDIDRGSSDERR